MKRRLDTDETHEEFTARMVRLIHRDNPFVTQENDRPTTEECPGCVKRGFRPVTRTITRDLTCSVCGGTGRVPTPPTTEEFATTLRVLVRSAEYELARDNHVGVSDLLTTIRQRLEEFAQPTTADPEEQEGEDEPYDPRCQHCNDSLIGGVPCLFADGTLLCDECGDKEVKRRGIG